jgi:hypothetical protein
MNSLLDRASEISEIQRLDELLPLELRSQVAITQSPEIDPPLISTVRINKHQFEIQIDFVCWYEIKPDQRNLLFWHEIARIQHRAIPRSTWEIPIMATGLAFSLIEIFAHNLISLSVALVVTGLSGNQLYQRNRGERSLREAVTCDRTAIYLAIQSGYSFSAAIDSLYDALKVLGRKTSQKSRWKKYQVRLRALEILASSQEKRLQSWSGFQIPMARMSLSSPIKAADTLP